MGTLSPFDQRGVRAATPVGAPTPPAPAGASPEKPLSVTQVARWVQGFVRQQGREVTVVGEVTNSGRGWGGKLFSMTLKDPAEGAKAQIDVVAFMTDLCSDWFPDDGALCQVRARPSFHPGNGRLRLQAVEFSPAGNGVLLARVEELRRRLGEEGLFDDAKKRPLPLLPQRIGLVTGADAAARGDVVRTIEERYPGMAVSLAPCLVQGPRCPGEVARALSLLDRDPRVSVIVLTRGGGSVEDLIGFNSEEVVRAVYACQTPVVAAIGHERDVTLVELVSDLRCSTPTAAAVAVCPERGELDSRLADLSGRVSDAMARRAARLSESLSALTSRPCLTGVAGLCDLRRREIAELVRRVSPATAQVIATRRGECLRERDRTGHSLGMLLRERRARLGGVCPAVVSALDPEAPLRRGYALVVDGSQSAANLVTSAQSARAVSRLVLRFADGSVTVEPLRGA